MNGRDVADDLIAKQYLAELQGFVEWVRESLAGHEDELTVFETAALRRAEKILEM